MTKFSPTSTLAPLALAVAALLSACSGGDNAQSKPAATQAHAIPVSKTLTVGSPYEDLTQELYLAYFGRPADLDGLMNVENALKVAGAPTSPADLSAAYASNAAVKTLVDSFALSKESQALYSNSSAAVFVTAVFQNLFGRQPAVAGLNFWVDAINSGSITQSAAALAIMGAAATNSSAQGKQDAQTVASRLAFAELFTNDLSVQGLTGKYVGSNAAATLRFDLYDVTANASTAQIDADVLAAIAQISGQTSPSGVVLNSVAWSGLQFVAVGIGGVVETSPDGITWTNHGQVFTTNQTGNTLRSIVWQGGRFLAVGATGGTMICDSNGTVVCTSLASVRYDSVLSSADGITWVNSMSSASQAKLPAGSELNSLVWTGTQFVAVGDAIGNDGGLTDDNGHVLTSSDGVNWSVGGTQFGQPPTTLAGILPPLAAVSSNGSNIVAAGGAQDIFASSDAIQWIIATGPGSATITGMAWSGGRYVAVATGGMILSSADGKSWTIQRAASSDLYAVTWSGTQFVAVGTGVALNSPDGLTWTAHSSGTSGDTKLFGVTWSGTKFVAVGVGAAATSSDGVNWTASTVN